MSLPKLAIPKYALTIPSTGVEIEYRPYLVGEEKILMIASESKDESEIIMALQNVIERCIVTQGVSVKNLKMFDLEYIFIKLRSKSVGETSDLVFTCTKCSKENKVKINLESQLTVTSPDSAAGDGEVLKIALTDDIGIMLKYPNVGTTVKLNKTTDVIEKIALCIDYIYEGDTIYDSGSSTLAELALFLESLTTVQFDKFTQYFDTMPKVTLSTEFTCSNTECGHVNVSVMEGIQDFL
jgi:transcription elongation factor Elf1